MNKGKLKKENESRSNAGAPSKYKEEYCDLIIELGKEGKLPIIWAKEIGVCHDTLREWTKAYPKFSESFIRAKDFCQAAIIEKMGLEPSKERLNCAKFLLGAAFGFSETKKVEQTIDVKAKLKDIFEENN